MQKMKTKDLVVCAMIGALYTALCLALTPFSYGMVQVRAAEALTLLPIFSPLGVWGVTLGCALSNLVGFFMGVNLLGAMDILFGTAATLLAAVCSRMLRHVRLFGVPFLSAVPPVVFNAVIVGAELALVGASGESFGKVFALNAAYVALGQMAACFGLGLPLACVLERTGVARRLFGPDDSLGRLVDR